MTQTTNLYFEYYSHKTPERKKEIDDTLVHNLKLNFISSYYIFCSDENKKELLKLINNNSKVIIVDDNERKTFQDIFNFSNTKNAEINITLNNDIKLSDSLATIKLMDTDFYCLSRWESMQDVHPFCYRSCDSQDVWLWKNKNKISNANFYFGILGCDNKLALLAKEAGYSVKNPAYTYRVYHNHASSVREGSRDVTLRLPGPYLKVCPSK